jgi:hypothetical protein
MVQQARTVSEGKITKTIFASSSKPNLHFAEVPFVSPSRSRHRYPSDVPADWRPL